MVLDNVGWSLHALDKLASTPTRAFSAVRTFNTFFQSLRSLTPVYMGSELSVAELGCLQSQLEWLEVYVDCQLAWGGLVEDAELNQLSEHCVVLVNRFLKLLLQLENFSPLVHEPPIEVLAILLLFKGEHGLACVVWVSVVCLAAKVFWVTELS